MIHFHTRFVVEVWSSGRYEFLTYPLAIFTFSIIEGCVYVKFSKYQSFKVINQKRFTSLNDNIEWCQAIGRSVASCCQRGILTEDKRFEHSLYNTSQSCMKSFPFSIVVLFNAWLSGNFCSTQWSYLIEDLCSLVLMNNRLQRARIIKKKSARLLKPPWRSSVFFLVRGF